MVWVQTSMTPDFLLILQSEITPDMLRGQHGIVGIKPGLTILIQSPYLLYCYSSLLKNKYSFTQQADITGTDFIWQLVTNHLFICITIHSTIKLLGNNPKNLIIAPDEDRFNY